MGTLPPPVLKAMFARVSVLAFQSIEYLAIEKVGPVQVLLYRPMTCAGSPGMAAKETSLQERGAPPCTIVNGMAPFSPRKNSVLSRSCASAWVDKRSAATAPPEQS